MKLLTVKQLSQIISIKETTLYAWASQALIPSYKLNGVLRFDLDEIEHWIENSRITPKKKIRPKPKNLGNQKIDRIIKRAIDAVKGNQL